MNSRILSIFDFLRFPLMIGVVMIHCDISDQIDPVFREQWSGNIMYLLSNAPILNLLIRFGFLFIIVLGILWLGFDIEFLGIELTGFFFFTLGGILASYKIRFVDFSRFKLFIVLMFLMAIISDLNTRGTTYYFLVHKIVILLGMAVCFMTAAVVSKTEKIKKLMLQFAPTTFFVYAFHGLFVATLRKGLCFILQPTSNVLIICVYVFSITLTIALSLLGYHIIKRLSPKTCAILSGGR